VHSADLVGAQAALIVQIDPPPPGWVFAEDLRDLDDLHDTEELDVESRRR
jgi:hypothetical protein